MSRAGFCSYFFLSHERQDRAMVKYTEDELLEFQEIAYNPQPQVLDAFNQMVDEVRELANAEIERQKHLKWSNGDTYIDEKGNERPYHHLNRRRGSRSGAKPNLKRKGAESVTVDDDGWATLAKPKKSFGAEEASEERTKFRDGLKDTSVKARPNNKNLGSSKAVDPRDAIAEKNTISFNAFEALGDESDDDDE